MDIYLIAGLAIACALLIVLALRWSLTYHHEREREADAWRKYQERMAAPGRRPPFDDKD